MIAWLALACGDRPVQLGSTPAPETTWHRDVRPIAEARCVGCHIPGGVAPLDLTDPAVVESVAPLLAAAVARRDMPPWSFDPSCRDPVGSMWLSDDELARFASWSESDYAMGDPAEYVPPVLPPPLDPGPSDELLAPAEPYTPVPGTTDDYRCQLVGAPTSRELYVTGVRVVPDNTAVVHHAVVYAFMPQDRALLDALAAQDPEPGFACGAGPVAAGALSLGGWTPGSAGQFLPEGTAMRIPTGSTVVLSMHYNTDGQTDPGDDQTPVELWTLPEGEVPAEVVISYWVPMLGLEVPAGDPASVQTAASRIPVNGRILASTPHMHYHGTALHTSVLRPDGEEVCVSDLDRWDFDWQRAYEIPEGEWIPLSVDDRVQLSCLYDNSDNATDLRWGVSTADEMCLDFLNIVVPWEGGTTGGLCSGYPSCNASCAPDDPFCSLACMTSSGDGCLFVGLEAIVGRCVQAQCGVDSLALDVCMAGCSQHFEQQFDCLYDQCRGAFDRYWACAEPLLEAGAPGCEAEFDKVPEILGG